MGMFQPHNYGTDFLQGLTAVNGMYNDERKLKLEEQRQAEDAKTRSLQQEGLALDNKKKSAEVEREQKLTEFFDHTNRLDAGELQDKDKARLVGVTEDLIKDTPYITDDVLQNPAGYMQKVKDLAEGVASIRTLPVGNYKYSRDDNVPEVNNMLDSYGSLLSKDRLGKTFTDSDGSVTGKAGAKYKTLAADGFMMASGEGNKAGFVPLFSVADESGNPIIGADGRRVLVPATMGTTNGADDKLRVISPEELLTKAGYAMKVARVVQTLGLNDPVKRQQYAAEGMKQYLSPDEQAKLVIAETKKEKKYHEFDPHKTYLDENGNVVQAAQEKEKTPETPHNLFGGAVKGGDLARQYPEAKGLKPNGYYRVTKDNGKLYFAEERAPREPQSGGSGEKGSSGKLTAAVLTKVENALSRRYLPVARGELKRQGREDEKFVPNASGVYDALGDTGKQVYDRSKEIAEENVAKGMNPETAVDRAIAQARKEYNLDSGGKVQSTPKQTPPPKQAPRQTKQVAQGRPPLSSFNKGK